MSERKMSPVLLRAMVAGVLLGIRARFPGGIGDWVKAQRVPITSKQNTTYQGERYDFDRFPVVASLMFGFFEDPRARELFVEKSVQTAFTTAAFFGCAWQAVEGDPGNIIYVMHTRDAARAKLKDVMKPILQGIPGLREGKSDTVSGTDAESTAEALRFPGLTIYVGGGQTPALLTSIPARIVIIDEAEQCAFMGKSSVFELARGRLTGADEGKLIAFSKPEKESEWVRDVKSGVWKVKPQLLALMDAEWVTGDQREFHCPCPNPACGVWQAIRWQDIRFKHLDERLPGMKSAMWNFERFEKEVHWRCPKCEWKVFDGPEKRAMILAGARAGAARCWVPARREDRRQAEACPVGFPCRWSAKVTALTDIAFQSLTWGKLAARWIQSQGNSTKLVNFRNEVLGEPDRAFAVEDVTLEGVRKLIPPAEGRDPQGWRYRGTDGLVTGRIPLLNHQIAGFVGDDGLRRGGAVGVAMVVDRQTGKVGEAGYLRYAVRCFDTLGRSFLLDQGYFEGSTGAERYSRLAEFMGSERYVTVDGAERGIELVWMDLGGEEVQEAYDFCWEYGDGHFPRVEGVRGVGDDATGRLQRGREGGYVWVNTRKNCPERPVQFWEIDSQAFERELYEIRIGEYVPGRHRSFAPALFLPLDIEEEWLRGMTAMHCVDVPVRKGSPLTRRMYVKRHSAAVNDPGDIEKLFLAMDYWYGGRQKVAGLQEGGRDYVLRVGEAAGDGNGNGNGNGNGGSVNVEH